MQYSHSFFICLGRTLSDSVNSCKPDCLGNKKPPGYFESSSHKALCDYGYSELFGFCVEFKISELIMFSQIWHRYINFPHKRQAVCVAGCYRSVHFLLTQINFTLQGGPYISHWLSYMSLSEYAVYVVTISRNNMPKGLQKGKSQQVFLTLG